MKRVAAFTCGLVFALGLGLAGMTQPERVLAFLDVAGAWDPSLAFVMGSAVLVGLALVPVILARPRPWLGGRFVLPHAREIDVRLLAGAALFGVGWGLSGYCPGPALVSLVTGSWTVLVFVAAMAVGLRLARPNHER
jgi:uncharacterized membrane protein YedE/YeeE